MFENADSFRDTAQIQETLREQLRFILSLDATKSYSYMAAKKPCAFLDQEKHECRIYDIRPAACRTYFVVSPAANCSPDRVGHEVHFIDYSEPVKALVPAMMEETKRIPFITGAFQSMVLLGMEMLSRTPEDFEALLAQSNL
jgi:Fe-S-cluster containining protein